MIKLIVAALALAVASPAAPQDMAPSVETAPIEAASWLEGRWVGTGMGGEVEEVWSPAAGGQMVGHFTYSRDGQPVFYEILLIRPDKDGAGLEMLVKHFNADFTAWEEKDEWVTFEAGSVGPGTRIDMNGLSLVLEGGVLTATVTMRQRDGSVSDVPFVMERAD